MCCLYLWYNSFRVLSSLYFIQVELSKSILVHIVFLFQEPFLMGLLVFHFLLLVTTIISRKNSNFQMCLFLLALGGVYLAEKLNKFLRENWRIFATQNYFDSHGIFLSTLWSGPLLVMAIIILVNTLFNLCYLIVKWKKAELRHKAKLSHNKHD
ncbi:hypothetical protein SAY87_003530 [Trapa incisa]|uniref:Transmembrane protein 18 n=1 Tax=Trapa incisa TaxID=236973 RepID=A0AAN7KNY2_9MYRT|nr:hypothetical protein SAY87_003530 [Trapa incisa]